MGSTNLLKLVLRETGLSQKEIAKKLNVSAAQISKWKAGEHISYEMEEKLKVLLSIGDRDPDVVYWTGGIEQADKWVRLFEHLAERAPESAECSYICAPLEDETDFFFPNILSTLIEAGAIIPEYFPEKIDFDYDADYDENEEAFGMLYDTNEFSNLIYEALKAYCQHYDFYAAYVRDIMYEDDLDLYNTDASNIEPCLFSLALVKVGSRSSLLSKYKEFRYNTLKDYKRWVEIVKDAAIKNRIPLKAEIMHLVSENPEHLVHEAEAEVLGFNSSRIHPDIYMNEMLQGMRLIHQVLPAICKKLGITEEELNINESELQL